MSPLQRRTYEQMVESQKGFLVAIYASSVILATLLIGCFVAFIFKMGFFQPKVAKELLRDPHQAIDSLGGMSSESFMQLSSIRKIVQQ